MKFDLLSQINNKIPKHTRICFITGIIVGWLTHFYMLTHKLPNWDDMNNLNTYGSGDYLGRWFLKYIHPLGGIFSIPAAHGFLFILLLTISACIILEIVNIRSATGAALTASVMLTFPSVVSTMTFMFMSHTSGIAICLTCIAVYLLRKYKWGCLPCGVLLICVLGTYQSYISFAITLILMGMFSDILSRDKKFPEILKEGIISVLVLGISVLVYMKLSHIIYPNLDNETYGGVGNMGQIAISEMPILIARCYKRFLEFFLWKPFAFMTKTAQVTNILTCILAVVLFVYIAIEKKMYKDIWTFILLLVVCGFVPLAAAFIYFMAPDVDYSMLMLYAYALIFVMVLAMLDYCMKIWEQTADFNNIKKYVAQIVVIFTVAVISVSCYSDYLLTNRAYLRMDVAKERVESYFNRILARVEATDGYIAGDGVTILGDFYYKDNPSTVEIDAFDSEDLKELSGVALENGLITGGVRDNFIRTFVGFDVAHLDYEEKEEIKNSEQYKEMAVYPQDGCVQKINDVWVVKLCE